MRTLLKTLLEEFTEMLHESKGLQPRTASFPIAEDAAKVAIGMRRTGKTYFILQKIHAMLGEGIDPSQVCYINFEDERLIPMSQKEMGMLLDAFYSIYPENHQRTVYLFLDEVQNIEGWALVIRRFLDKKKTQIYLTGSSSKLLSKEIATSLRGRSLSTEIWPYSFHEYLAFHNIAQPTPPLGKPSLDEVRKHFLNYLQRGGFPGVQTLTEHEHLETLQNYVETVILRDVIERHNISNIALLRYLIKVLLKSFAAPFSVNKFYKDIKSQGYKVGKDTLYNYIGYLEDAYLIFSVPAFTESLRRQQNTPNKIYAIDSGLILANTFNISDNLGNIFENLVYLDLRRQNKEVFFYNTQAGYEIDFVARNKQGECELIQVVWDQTAPETLAREQRALEAAQDELGLPGRIIDVETYLQFGI